MRFFLTLIAALILVAHPVDASSVKSHSNSTAVMSSPSVQNVEPGTAKAQDVESVARKANQKKARIRRLSDRNIGRSNEDVLLKIESKINNIEQELDSLSDLSEEESIKLQMLQERMSKMATTLSNILKKYSDTKSAIIQNIK
ncbi:MAG: hypothetical protein KAS59_09670 [Alphaproteobacteria bacterium]|nr:hypothetical protein [Alphaproteobacteria bacterium]